MGLRMVLLSSSSKKYYTNRLLLNRVTAGIEAFVSGSKSLYACVKEVCCL
jgi:hypothetical protein